MGRTEIHYFDIVLPQDYRSTFQEDLKGELGGEIFSDLFEESEDWILEDEHCSPYESGKLPDEEKLPTFYKDFLLEPPEAYETITVKYRIKGWFQEGVEGFLKYVEKLTNNRAVLIAGGSYHSSGSPGEPYEVLFEVKDIEKLKGEKRVGKRSKKESVTIRCVICNEDDRSILCLPCRHVATCEKCSLKSSTCPLCKANIGKREEVFLS